MDTKIFRIYGPPELARLPRFEQSDEALSNGVDPTHIGYFAFTRQAANEGRAGLCTVSSDKSQLPWFRTLHSFALRLSGIRQEQVMQPEHYKEVGLHLASI